MFCAVLKSQYPSVQVTIRCSLRRSKYEQLQGQTRARKMSWTGTMNIMVQHFNHIFFAILKPNVMSRFITCGSRVPERCNFAYIRSETLNRRSHCAVVPVHHGRSLSTCQTLPKKRSRIVRVRRIVPDHRRLLLLTRVEEVPLMVGKLGGRWLRSGGNRKSPICSVRNKVRRVGLVVVLLVLLLRESSVSRRRKYGHRVLKITLSRQRVRRRSCSSVIRHGFNFT